jgi:hypothetical protein
MTKLIRNDIYYTVTSENATTYEATSEEGQFTLIPKALLRNNYNGERGYYFTAESYNDYWNKKFNALK